MSDSQRINDWMMAKGRLLGDGIAIVEAYVARLVAAGVPLARANIAQLMANPLLVGWGMVWTPDGTNRYEVTRAILETDSYIGGPFEYVLTKLVPLHKSLVALDRGTEHSAYLDLADAGGTDLYANILEYGDGSVQGCTYVSNHPGGFSERHIDLIESTRNGLSAALEPVAMRKSTESLLHTYLGDGPARAVCNGTIQRGGHKELEAVVVITDLRGFTHKTETWGATRLLTALDGYFDAVVTAIEDNHGDVLKFMGDGILSIFPIGEGSTGAQRCNNAVDAVRAAFAAMDDLNSSREKDGEEPLSMGVGISRGPVTYGNIGSPARLDFTVLGPAVNLASRVQDLCKTVGVPALATASVVSSCTGAFQSKGHHAVRGVAEPVEIFALNF